MSDITVVIYSYKGKLLKDVVNNLFINLSNDNSIDIIILDQHPFMRSNIFEKQNVMYHHIFWDWIYGPCVYKNNTIKNIKTKYTLLLSDNILLSKNWDTSLINFINKDIVISGNHKINLTNNNLFYLSKNEIPDSGFYLNQYIDKSFIFTETQNLLDISYPNYLKYNGEEEALSIKLFTHGKDIYSCPTNLYTKIGENTIETLYVPFSINHNYNEVIDLLNTGQNKFDSILNLKRSIEDFNFYHNNIFKQMKKLPFYTNDVEYSPDNLEFNKIDARKFVARTRAIL